MLKNNGRPYFLPQVRSELTEIFKRLTEEGIDFELVQVDPNILTPSQGIVFSDEIKSDPSCESNPIWISEDNNVVDGHHRWCGSIFTGTPIFAVKIKLNFKDACRVLNKIQDILNYEELQQLESVANDYSNEMNSNNNNPQNEFLSTLESDNSSIDVNTEKGEVKPEVVVGYRKAPLLDGSIVGNFFSLEPIQGYDKYEIEFDNLLSTNDLGIDYKSGQVPTDVLVKAWFPHINFEKLAKEYGVDVNNLKNKAIAHKAMSHGFDGIKYGDTLIQGLK